MPQIAEHYPDLVVLHIGDAIARAIKQKKMQKVDFEIITIMFAVCHDISIRSDFWVHVLR